MALSTFVKIFKIFFNMNHFKSLCWIYYTIVSVLCFVYFGLEACGILVPRPGIEPTPPAQKGKVLTTGPPGKSLTVLRTSAFKLWVKQDLRNYRLGEFSGINSRRKPLSQSLTINPALTPLISNVAWNKLTFLGCKLTERALESETVPGSSYWQS